MSEQKKFMPDCCKIEYTFDEVYKKDDGYKKDYGYKKDCDCKKDYDYKKDDDCKKKFEFKKKSIKVPEVIGRNSTQVLIESVIAFPECFPAVEIKDVVKKVKDLSVHVCKNKVLINGVLHKNINYKTFEGEIKCGKLDTFFGDVKHIGVDMPFAAYIDVPGAKPGDKYQIEFAGVEDGCEVDILEDPIPKCSVKAYKKLREKVIVKIDLKVLREVQITVCPEKCDICP